MFKEDSFKHLLFWLKVKRIFFIVFITLAGSVLGGVLSSYLVDVLMYYDLSKNNIVFIFAVVSFTFASFITTSISQAIQDGYWKIATLRKLTLISKKLDSLQRIEEMLTPEMAKEIKEATKDIKDINVIPDEENYSIFDEEVQSEIIENNVEEDISNNSKKNTFIYAMQEAAKNAESSSEDVTTSSKDVTAEQINKLEGTNLDHISKTMAILSNEYDETINEEAVTTDSTVVEAPVEDNSELDSTEEKVDEIIIEDDNDDESLDDDLEQTKIEDIEEIVKTIKIENKTKHTYKRKHVPGSSNAIAMATEFEKNKDEIKFKNNIIEENTSEGDEQKQIINENNENSK